MLEYRDDETRRSPPFSDMLALLRAEAMQLRKTENISWVTVADIIVVHINTVMNWARRFETMGEAGFDSAPRGRKFLSGRKPMLVQELHIRTIVIGASPRQLRLPFTLWNRRAVMDLIEKLCGVQVSIDRMRSMNPILVD